MKIDHIGNCIIDIEDVVDHLMAGGNLVSVNGHMLDFSVTDYNDLVSSKDKDQWRLRSVKPYGSAEQMDAVCGEQWTIPSSYLDMDIETYVYNLCETEAEVYRVQQELELFKSRDLLIVLKALKYLIDVMRQHRIVWGVGRGSSVASYCLYLLEVHSIDSIKYNLDFSEFLD